MNAKHITECKCQKAGIIYSCPLHAAAPEMLSALESVDGVVKEILKEAGERPTGVTNWGLVNDSLVAISRAIAKARRK